jgi:hypothetical protein
VATLIEAQLNGALIDDIPLQFDDKTKRVNLKVLVIFIIGDIQGEGQDMLHHLLLLEQIKLTLS